MSGSYSPTSWADGVTTLGPTNLNKLENGVRDAYTQAHGILNAKDAAYGAKGDGVTDDTVALQNFLNDFASLSSDPGHLGVTAIIPPGKYKVTSTLTLAWTNPTSNTKTLSAYGVYLQPTISGTADVLRVFATISGVVPDVRNLTIEGLMIDGSNATTTGAMLHMNADANSLLYRWALRDICIEHFAGHGLLLDGDLFEGAIYSPRIMAANTNTTGSCIYIDGSTGAGAGGSIDIYGGTLYQGLHNVYATSASPKIFGGTYLLAYNEAIYMDNSIEGGLTGVHVENAWQGGAASPSWTTSQAGIYVANALTLVNVTGTQNNNKMRYIARINAANPCCVVGGTAAGGVEYYLRPEGSGKMTAIGIGSGTGGAIDSSGAGAPLVRVGVRPDVSGGDGTASLQIDRGSHQIYESSATYGATVTPDASTGDIISITATNTTAFTIAPPTNPPQGNHSQRLTIEVVNLSGGAMGAITWSSAANGWHFAGLTWTNPGNGLLRRAVFEWSPTRGKWICTSVSSADY